MEVTILKITQDKSLHLGIKEMLKFLSDVLYIKEVICIDEYEAILDCSCGDDLEYVFENMMFGVYADYGRGGKEWETQENVKVMI